MRMGRGRDGNYLVANPDTMFCDVDVQGPRSYSLPEPQTAHKNDSSDDDDFLFPRPLEKLLFRLPLT
jgi:hypothetical protein